MDSAVPPEKSFEALLEYVRDARGFDFTGYKRASLMRRVRHRMDQVGIAEFGDYLDLLQADADEFDALFNTILINVTSFFRDSDAWNFLRTDTIPKLLAERGPADRIRVWSAGCATGQEAYAIAMLLADAMGTEPFRQRVKVYATDIDEDALVHARHATYDATAVESVPPQLLQRYFEQVGSKYAFRKDLRRAVIFGRNDLVQDAPISRIDLLICRNTLMYLNAETQKRVLSRLHFALAPQGVLMLGHAEMLLGDGDRYTPVSLKQRIFRKAVGSAVHYERFESPAPLARHGSLSGLEPLREMAFRASPIPQIVITGDDTIAMINQQAELVFGLSVRDIGRLLRDLEVSYRPVDLRTFIEQAKVERRGIRLPDVEWARPGIDTVWFEIHVNPLIDADNGLRGVSIVFFDVTATRGLLDKLRQTNHQLEAAYEELQSTNEELETTNEELQSTVEELETTNEELQSTNEELETMNEELHSTNDELQSINDALRERTIELDNAKEFVDSIIGSIRVGLIVVDRDMRVVVWNDQCEDLWGLRRDEAEGEQLESLDIGLPISPLRPLVGNALVDAQYTGTAAVPATDRRGRAVRIHVTCSPFRDSSPAISGAILLLDTIDIPKRGDSA